MPPPDPRDPPRLTIVPPVDASVRAAKQAQDADRRRYIRDVATTHPRMALTAIFDLVEPAHREDVLFALTAFVELEIEHGSATLARQLLQYQMDGGRR